MQRSMRLIVDKADGTHVVGSKFERLITTFRDNHGDDFAHSAVSTLVFDPVEKHRVSEPWWLIAVTDNEIAKYYASQVNKQFGIKLDPPSWGAHVSVLRGQEPSTPTKDWAAQNGEKVVFKYTHDIYTNGEHWWLNVYSDRFAEIRSTYGFPEGKRHYHLTIGRTPQKLINS